jgi:hypothetical protein
MIRSIKISTGAVALAVMAFSAVAHAFAVPNFKGPDTTIASPGYPDFWATNFSASLQCTSNCSNSSKAVWTLSITGSNPNIGIFNFPNGAYLVGNEQVKLTANFSSTGTLLTNLANTYEIDGSLAPSTSPTLGSKPPSVSWTSQPVEKLFSSTLTGVTVDSTDEALGFKSTNFGGWANQKQFTGGSTTESVWLYSLLSCGFSSTGYSASSATNSSDSSCWGSRSGTLNSTWDTFLAEIKNHTALKSASFLAIASIATVPLPAAIWLLGSALAGLGGFARRRRQFEPEALATA